jgi:predicted HTH transcriptional regulator
MTREELEKLLSNNEDTWLDWKRDFPPELLKNSKDPEWGKGMAKLLKALVSIANSYDKITGLLIYGVEDKRTYRNVVGISKSWDDAIFQEWVFNNIDPPVIFLYKEIQYDPKKIIGIFTIHNSVEYPHVFKKDLGGVIYKGQVYFRRGSRNNVALYKDLKTMFLGEQPLKMEHLNGTIFEETKTYYETKGYEVCWPSLSNKDNKLAEGYKIAYYPRTRKEIWGGYNPRIGQYDHILMLKPRTTK